MTTFIVVDPSTDHQQPLVNSARVEEIFRDCLHTDEEAGDLAPGQAPDGAVIVEGVIRPFGLHPGRLASHGDEIAQMLRDLPTEFRSVAHGGGGGWSFLNACNDRNGVQWTGLHRTMDMLLVLGIGLGLAKWLLPREMWAALPGAMPYVVVDD